MNMPEAQYLSQSILLHRWLLQNHSHFIPHMYEQELCGDTQWEIYRWKCQPVSLSEAVDVPGCESTGAAQSWGTLWPGPGTASPGRWGWSWALRRVREDRRTEGCQGGALEGQDRQTKGLESQAGTQRSLERNNMQNVTSSLGKCYFELQIQKTKPNKSFSACGPPLKLRIFQGPRNGFNSCCCKSGIYWCQSSKLSSKAE